MPHAGLTQQWLEAAAPFLTPLAEFADKEITRRNAVAEAAHTKKEASGEDSTAAFKMSELLLPTITNLVGGTRAQLGKSYIYEGNSSPPNISRAATTYDWCRCGTGLKHLTLWPNGDMTKSVTVAAGSVLWISWGEVVTKVSWLCDGMMWVSSTSFPETERLEANMTLSINFFPATKPSFLIDICEKTSGRLHWNTWKPVNFLTSVPFSSPSEGYFCIKIPVLLRTHSGTLIAFAEARTPDCGDFAQTDLVYKRSFDHGQTWTALRKVVNVSGDGHHLGLCGNALVQGNAAPVQLPLDARKYPGRIWLPHTRNNFRVWITYSDDDGETWSEAREIKGVTNSASQPDCDRGMSYFGLDIDRVSLSNLPDFARFLSLLCTSGADPYKLPKWQEKLTGDWQFVGLGPPGSIQINGSRLVVPGYHSYIRGLSSTSAGQLELSQLYNNFALGHTMISDDHGDTWRLGNDWPMSNGANEHQIVKLGNGSLLLNSRALATGSAQFRLQSRSDNGGEDWTPTEFKKELPEPFNGCQGSMVVGAGAQLYVSHPDPARSHALVQDFADSVGCKLNLSGRDNMTVWTSSDSGGSYPKKKLIDAGMTGQSSMQYNNGVLMLLYDQVDEQADATPSDIAAKVVAGPLQVQVPDRLVFVDAMSSVPLPRDKLASA